MRHKTSYKPKAVIRKVFKVLNAITNWKLFLIIYVAFWLNFKSQPFRFEEVSNILIIFCFFYIPIAAFFMMLRFLKGRSRFYSVPLSVFGLIALPIIFYAASPIMNPLSSIEIDFLFNTGFAYPLAIASLFCILGSLPAYFRLIRTKPQYFMYSAFSFLLIIYVISVEVRLYTSNNGYNKFFCSYHETKNLNSQKVVRIIGSFSEGSGFFVEDDLVITNRHVVAGEDYPKIVLPTGQFLTPTSVELSKEYDIAYLYLGQSQSDYKINTSRAELGPGEEVLSFGYPLGSSIKGDPTILPIRFENVREMPKDDTEYLQFSTPLVSGMSGGPVFDKCGDFVGVSTMTTSGTSLVISAKSLEYSYIAEKEEPKKITLKPGLTPTDSVYAYYYLLKARDTTGCYNLLSSGYKTKSTYEEWTARFPNVISVEVYDVAEIKPNLVYVSFDMSEWENGEQIIKNYEGTWETVKEGGVYHLNKSNILEMDNYLDSKGPESFLK